MKVLLYHQLDPTTIPGFEKTRRALEAGDFRSADVKKVGPNLYRARLDRSDRLLFSLYRHGGEVCVLVLEHIARHAYDKSRFLRRGVTVEESKLPDADADAAAEAGAEALVYLNPQSPTFHVLNKVISFDDAQQAIFAAPPPFVVVGSAGSGKTALTLEKMKLARGRVLYVTRSPYLVRHSRDQYYALGYENDDQEVSFLSFMEYLSSWRVPPGRELQYRDFARWFAGRRVASGLHDPYQLFEEFQGVLTGAPTERPYLSLDDYLGLGVKQSIFQRDERERVYPLFRKYLEFLRDGGLHDGNLLSFEYRSLVEPRYDFIVVDEVQDVTTVQLDVVLRSLARPGQFVLCGDANQIVHPNFFSWSKLKSFFHDGGSELAAGPIRILDANYRNSVQVTELANRILKLKTARFGSVDRESHYLVRSSGDRSGAVLLLPDEPRVTDELNRKTRRSTRFAVVVLESGQLAAAKARFETPLVFSVQEAKGLEYDNIVLYGFASGHEERFREIVRGVDREAVLAPEPRYARARDKTDKSLEIFKFHINALYVAVTRAVENVYLVEAEPGQRLFDLLGVKPSTGPLELAEQDSTLETWRQEARRLEQQGKAEQAEQIRSQILQERAVPWEVLEGDALLALERRALEGGDKKAKLLLFQYAQVYQDGRLLNALADAGFKAALQATFDTRSLHQQYFFPYEVRKPDLMLREVEQYGVDFRNVFNQTPLMIAARLGNVGHVERLVELGADTAPINNAGLNAFQIALEQACADAGFTADKLAAVYALLAPADMVLQVDGRLVKLDASSMEFLVLNLMIAMFYTELGERVAGAGGAFTSGDLVEALESFPDALVPARRKRRAYVSGVLSRNEVDRDDRYNRRLFLRVKHGHYTIAPRLALRVGEAWRDVYDLLSLDALALRHRGTDERYRRYRDEAAQIRLRAFRSLLEGRAAGGGPAAEPEEETAEGERRWSEQPRLDLFEA